MAPRYKRNQIMNQHDLRNDKGHLSTQRRYFPNMDHWTYGPKSTIVATGDAVSTTAPSSKVIIPSAMGDPSAVSYHPTDMSDCTDEELKREMLTNPVLSATSKTLWDDTRKRKELLNENKTLIQNSSSFPYYIQGSTDTLVAKYDYQITPGDTRYPAMVKLEDKLKEARASFGIHVHGNNDIARAVKFNLYNRFKTSDTNLAFNRLTTHVFFTRPDLNLLDCCDAKIYGATSQVKNHSDASLLYNTDPYIFRLLTDATRCGDSNNFNMLLSNQIASFDIVDEDLNASEVGKSWSGHSMFYGDGYAGRHAGEFSCQFAETQDLSVMKLMKLWITYIDNVSRGAWSPSYDLYGDGAKSKYGFYSPTYTKYSFGKSIIDSHVYTKTLDYAASVYVLKCGPVGDDLLYWTKYYGVFPVNTGASVLSWDGSPVSSDVPKLNIRFKYCYKRDLSPISLIELNETCGVGDMNVGQLAEASFNPQYNHSSRPYVGPPFVEIQTELNSFKHGNNTDMFGKSRTQIKLRFLKNTDPRLTDDLLYRNPYSSHPYNDKNTDINTYGNEVQLC